MKFLGNIVTDSKMEDMVLYNIVKTIDDIDKTIPTLIIGWSKVNTIYSDVKILEWKINKMTYWTFGRRERGERYLSDLENFQNICLKHIYNTVNYSFFNILIEDKEKKKEFFKILKSKTNNKTFYIENDLLYCYVNDSDVVYGISLTDIEYENEDPKKLLSLVYRSDSSKLIKNTDVNFNIKIMFINRPYLIPYLFS